MEAKAWAQVDGRRCGGCGGDLDETTHPDNEDVYDAHLVTCFRCAAKGRAAKEYGDANGDMAGVMSYTTGSPEFTVS